MTNKIIYHGTLWLFEGWCLTELEHYETHLYDIYRDLYNEYCHIVPTEYTSFAINGKENIIYKYDVVTNG